MYFMPVLLFFAAGSSYYFGQKEDSKQFKKLGYIMALLGFFSLVIIYTLRLVLTYDL